MIFIWVFGTSLEIKLCCLRIPINEEKIVRKSTMEKNCIELGMTNQMEVSDSPVHTYFESNAIKGMSCNLKCLCFAETLELGLGGNLRNSVKSYCLNWFLLFESRFLSKVFLVCFVIEVIITKHSSFSTGTSKTWF